MNSLEHSFKEIHFVTPTLSKEIPEILTAKHFLHPLFLGLRFIIDVNYFLKLHNHKNFLENFRKCFSQEIYTRFILASVFRKMFFRIQTIQDVRESLG